MNTELWNKVRRIQIRTSRMVTDLFSGAYSSAFKGRGMEFEDVREYQPGDEVRTIDWNVTARMSHPYVKNFREERELTVMLIVDMSASGKFGTKGRSKRELIAELGAVLALAATRNNDRVGLLLFTDQVERYFPPKRGMGAVLRVIRELLAFEPKGEGTDIAGALAYLNKVHRRKGVCFLISDFIAAAAEQEVVQTARRHDLTALCVTDPCELDFPKGGPGGGMIPVRDLESGKVTLVDTGVAGVIDRLRDRVEGRIESTKSLMNRLGGSFVDVRTDRDYLIDLQRAFQKR